MYTTVRQYTGITDQAFAALLGRRADIEALIEPTPGFAQYDLIRTPDGMTSVTVCADQNGVEDSNRRMAAWIQANLPALATPPPQIVIGESVIHMTAGTTPVWNSQTHNDYDALKGFDVFSSDNERVGTVAAVYHAQASVPATDGDYYFAVKPGMLMNLFGTDEVYIPESAIQAVADGKVTLGVAKTALQAQNWAAKPASWTAVSTS
jgi:hypothetical protein